MTAVTLTFEDGTIRVEGGADLDLPHLETDPRSKASRVPAFRYGTLLRSLDERGIEYDDRVIDAPSLDVVSAYELRDYQREALDAWRASNDRGCLELPTGSGKTVIGIEAIEELGTATLVVVPTIDLLEQWRRELDTEFDVTIGQLGGGEQRVEALTVSTYDSAYLRAEDIGDRFGLVVFDEVHHLGGEGYRDIARLLAAPARLGLTATFERPDGAHEVIEELCGPLVHRVTPEELAGEHLAAYDIKRLDVSLTDAERAEYDRHRQVFTDYLAQSNLDMQSGSDYRKLVMRSGSDPKARAALLANQRAREVMLNADAKVKTLADILERHREDRLIVFTAHNDLVYRLAERFLIPAITHQTDANERCEILDKFRTGEYSRVVTANVLDEGVDVPDANVAVVLSGSGSEREFTQRLGRILRPTEEAVPESTDSGASEASPTSRAGRALLYEVVTEGTAEERVAERRR